MPGYVMQTGRQVGSSLLSSFQMSFFPVYVRIAISELGFLFLFLFVPRRPRVPSVFGLQISLIGSLLG